MDLGAGDTSWTSIGASGALDVGSREDVPWIIDGSKIKRWDVDTGTFVDAFD